MATIDDLGYTSISSMDIEEAYELIKQIRFSRRIPTKTKKAKKKTTPKKKKPPVLNAEQATELLKQLGVES